jgi:hypothetical protein
VNRYRVPIIAVVVVVFLAVGGILIYSNLPKGGQNVTFNVTVTGATKMSPDTLTAHQNDTITLNVTSDTDGEVHLHGYDIAIETKAGQTVTEKFKADRTGDFQMEWEDTSAPLGHLVVS